MYIIKDGKVTFFSGKVTFFPAESSKKKKKADKDSFSFQKPTEKSIVKAIIGYLNKQPGFHWKVHGGAFSAKAGLPDIFYFEKRKNGGAWVLALEAKCPGKKATKLQEETLKKLEQAGCVSVVVHDREEVKRLLESLRKGDNDEQNS